MFLFLRISFFRPQKKKAISNTWTTLIQSFTENNIQFNVAATCQRSCFVFEGGGGFPVKISALKPAIKTEFFSWFSWVPPSNFRLFSAGEEQGQTPLQTIFGN
jgi:hypothetical protein